MRTRQKSIGAWGERYACEYLRRRRYRIVVQNWSARAGEADIIAFDIREACLVFIEVKARTSRKFGAPEASIGERKKRALERVIAAYTSAHRYGGAVRVDVIAIERHNGVSRVRHLKNVSFE